MENITRDKFLGGKLHIYQPKDGFRAGSDTVLMAAATPVKPQQIILEMGCGVGTALMCLGSRDKKLKLIGLDVQVPAIHLAQRNSEENKIPAIFHVWDINANAGEDVSSYKNKVDHVLMNPPYFDPQNFKTPPNAARACARIGSLEDFEKWVCASHKFLKPSGTLTLVFPSDILQKTICTLKASNFGSLEIIPLWPKQGLPAKRILLRAKKAGRGKTTLYPGIVLHEATGAYTQEAHNILMEGHPIILK